MGSVRYGVSVAFPRVTASTHPAPLGGVTGSALESGRAGCGPNHPRWGFSLRARHLGSRGEKNNKIPERDSNHQFNKKRSSFILVSFARLNNW